MKSNLLFIDASSVEDRPNDRKVMFEADLDGQRLRFSITYDALEHITGDVPGTDGAAMFWPYSSRIQVLAAEVIRKNGQLPINVINAQNL